MRYFFFSHNLLFEFDLDNIWMGNKEKEEVKKWF